MAAPMIPGLNDHEMPNILQAAAEAGAQWAGYEALRLPCGVKEIFATRLEQHFPERKEKVLNQVRAMRGGKLNDQNFGSRMAGQGIFAEGMTRMFEVASRKAGLPKPHPALTVEHFRRLAGPQLGLEL